MKKLMFVLMLLILLAVPSTALAGKPDDKGFDQWGYNYQAHIFNGLYWTGGSIIWGAYVRIQQVSNDTCGGEHGKTFAVEPAGFGAYK